MIDEAIDDELEARVRIAFNEMIPKLLDASSNSSAPADGFDDGVLDDGAFDAPNEVAVRRSTIERRSPRSLVATGLLVAAGVAGLVMVTQRDHDNGASTKTGVDASTETNATLPDGAIAAEPEWYRLIRPLIPDRFEYLSLARRYPEEIAFVAIDAGDGKALEISLVRGIDEPQDPGANITTDPGANITTLVPFATWTETAQGWVVSTSTGLNIGVSCDIGARGRDFPGPPNYCDMQSTGAFTKAEIRSVAEALATRFVIAILSTDIGVTREASFDGGVVTQMIADAVPGQTLISDTDWGPADRIIDFAADPQRPDTSVRVLQDVYPSPPATENPAVALYDDAAAFWMFSGDGIAVRISTTDTFPESLVRLEQLGAGLLAGGVLDLTPYEPAASTTTYPYATTTIVDTTIVNPTTTVFRRSTGAHLLPTVMPPGFDDVADGYTTQTEAADPDATDVRTFFGPGERPAVVAVFSTPASEVRDQIDVGLRDMTTSSSWPSFGFGIVRPSGEYLWLRSGGLSAVDMQFVADQLADDDATGLHVGTAAADFTEVPWSHDPRNAHGITWNGPEDQTITMYAEANHGIDALNAGISWSIQVVDTPIGQVFASVDATDASFVQVGLVIDGQVINFEAQNVAVDDVVAMVASIALADDNDWNRRIAG